MQQILAFTRKELQLWAQKPGSWILVFVVPLIFIWIMQSVFGSVGTAVMTVYAVDEDKSTKSERVMKTLREAENLKIEELETREEASQRVSAGERMAAVMIPNGFSQAVVLPGGAKVEIMLDPARAEQASIVTGLVNAALAPAIIDAEVSRGVENNIAEVMKTLPAETPPEAQNSPAESQPGPMQQFFTAAVKGVVSNQVEEALSNPEISVKVQPLEKAKDQAARRPTLLDYLVPGYSLMFVFFLISNIAATVIEERQSGTLRRLLIAPVPRSRILLGKMFPYFWIAVVQLTVVLLASKFIFGVDLGNSILALGVIILASAMAVVSLGILIAAFARSESQAGGLSIVLVLAMAVVSGVMFPNISIPGIKALTPHYWAMQGFINTIALGQDVQGVLLPAGILLSMSAVFFTIGAIRFRFE